MIVGIGTDLVEVARMSALWRRHGARALSHLLAEEERAECLASGDPARFLARRFAAKEALAKALGTGLRAPVLLSAMAVSHDELGKPLFRFAAPLATLVDQRARAVHLSLSDERAYVLAFVVLEAWRDGVD